MVIMRDVAIAKSEFIPGQKAVTKIQEYQNDEVMFQYARNKDVCIFILYEKWTFLNYEKYNITDHINYRSVYIFGISIWTGRVC